MHCNSTCGLIVLGLDSSGTAGKGRPEELLGMSEIRVSGHAALHNDSTLI